MAAIDEKRAEHNGSSLWQRALERYQDDLAWNGDVESIADITSLEELISYLRTVDLHVPGDQDRLEAMRRLAPTLKFVDDFSAVIAVFFGADAMVTALVWGSIRLVLRLASTTADTLKEVMDMIEEPSLTLPRFLSYEKTLPVDPALESALLSVYTEVICFYARCINFYKKHPQVMIQRPVWQNVRNDFSRTVKRIRWLSSAVEREADQARMRKEATGYKEVLELMDSSKATKLETGKESAFVHHVPARANPRFWGRDKILKEIADTLIPDQERNVPESFALYGMGGVGKTQLALQFANRQRKAFPTIMWIAADNAISIGQSFRDIAEALNLLHNDDESRDTVLATIRVQHWLADSTSPWLMIFDNADDLEVLRNVWPSEGCGCILLTSRDANAPFSPASSGVHVKPFDEEEGSRVLLNYVGLDANIDNNRLEAGTIARTLGGLPLALGQIGGFITQRRMRLKDFLPLYERKSASIHDRKTSLTDYEHTLSTVWSMSFSKLSPESRNLVAFLAYLQPDSIDESMLLQNAMTLDNTNLSMLQDEMDLGDAEEELLKSSLIYKDSENASLSIHRLMQSMIIRGQSAAERLDMFQAAIDFLTSGFPDTASEDCGSQFQTWATCEKCLPHAHNLVGIKSAHKIGLPNGDKYAELLRRCALYLYEREQYHMAREMIDAALVEFEDQTGSNYCAAVCISGYIDMDMNRNQDAIAKFEQVLAVRKSQLPEMHALIASSYNEIAVAMTETGDLRSAYEIHRKALEIRQALPNGRVTNTYSNMAALLLRMGKPDEAEQTLGKCPDLKDLSDDAFLANGNPRFSGDMVLLSRIRFAQGRLVDATRLASKALLFRRQTLGNRLKSCDSLFDVAYFISKQGNTISAIDMLEQLIGIAAVMPEGKGQLARANWLLSVLHAARGRTEESEHAKRVAEDLRAEIRPDLKDAPFEESEFRKLCLFMLW